MFDSLFPGNHPFRRRVGGHRSARSRQATQPPAEVRSADSLEQRVMLAAPVLNLTSAGAVVEPEQPPVLVVTEAVVTDSSTAVFTNAVLDVELTSGVAAGDQILVVDTSDVDLQGNTIVIDNEPVANVVAVSPKQLQVTFTGPGVLDKNVAQVIEAVGFIGGPSNGNRTVEFTLTDPDGNKGGASVTTTVDGTLVAGVPATQTLPDTPGSDPIAPNAVVFAPTQSPFAPADLEIEILNKQVGDDVVIDVTDPRIQMTGNNVFVDNVLIGTRTQNVVPSFPTSTTLAIDFNTNATPDRVQALLRAISLSTANDPFGLDRQYEIRLDGAPVVTTTVDVVGVPQWVIPNGTITETFNLNERVPVFGAATVSDPELATPNGATLFIGRNSGSGSNTGLVIDLTGTMGYALIGDNLLRDGQIIGANIPNGSSSSFEFDFNSNATFEDVNVVLRSVYVTNFGGSSSPTHRARFTTSGVFGPRTAFRDRTIEFGTRDVSGTNETISFNVGQNRKTVFPNIDLLGNIELDNAEVTAFITLNTREKNDELVLGNTAAVQGTSVIDGDIIVNGRVVAKLIERSKFRVKIRFERPGSGPQLQRTELLEVIKALKFATGDNGPDRTIRLSILSGSKLIEETVQNFVDTSGGTAPPKVFAGHEETFLPFDIPTFVMPALTVTDFDSPDFNGGFINITLLQNGRQASDQLSFLNSSGVEFLGNGDVRVDGVVIGAVTFDGRFGKRIDFTTGATVNRVQRILRRLRMEVTEQTNDRRIRVVVDDGDGRRGRDFFGVRIAPADTPAPSVAASFVASQPTPISLFDRDDDRWFFGR